MVVALESKAKLARGDCPVKAVLPPIRAVVGNPLKSFGLCVQFCNRPRWSGSEQVGVLTSMFPADTVSDGIRGYRATCALCAATRGEPPRMIELRGRVDGSHTAKTSEHKDRQTGT